LDASQDGNDGRFRFLGHAGSFDQS
jgi:hypothetical protein